MMKPSFILLSCLVVCACSNVDPNMAKPNESTLSGGKKIAFTFEQGNCLACHVIAEGDSPGNIGPELKALPLRFKDKTQLRQFIWDATQFNPNTSMPPFGKNKILSDAEINQVVDYLWELK